MAADERFGRMTLTRTGLHARDRFVPEPIRPRNLPVVPLLSGGYTSTLEFTADLHAIPHREAARIP